MKRSARMLAGLGFLFVTWRVVVRTERNATGFGGDQGIVRADEKRTRAGDGGKQKLRKLEVAVKCRAYGARIMSC